MEFRNSANEIKIGSSALFECNGNRIFHANKKKTKHFECRLNPSDKLTAQFQPQIDGNTCEGCF